MMSKKNFIFDMETIGPNSRFCPVVDMAYTVFVWDRFLVSPYTFEELVASVKTVKLSVADQMQNYGCSFKKEDVTWWEKLPKAARDKLRPTEEDLTVPEFCDTIISYLREQNSIDYWWSRGNSFDPVILERLMQYGKQSNLSNQYLRFYKVRDIRTYIDAKFNFSTKSGFVPLADEKYWKETFVAHDSTHDVAADILRLQAIYRAENDLEQTTR
jgi:hypothetical protein